MINNKIKAKDTVAKNHGYYDWQNLIEQGLRNEQFSMSEFVQWENEAMELYHRLELEQPTEVGESSLPYKPVLKEAFVKGVLGQYTKEEISFGKMVELFNQKIAATPQPSETEAKTDKLFWDGKLPSDCPKCGKEIKWHVDRPNEIHCYSCGIIIDKQSKVKERNGWENVFQNYGKPLTSGRDLWDYLQDNYNPPSLKSTQIKEWRDCRDAVRWFAEQMERKLTKNDHKGGWKDCELQYLSMRLTQERKELTEAIESRDNKRIINECADIANFALMIADKFGNKYGK